MLLPRQRLKLARGTKDKEHALTLTLKTAMAGVDIGKNSFHVVGLDQRGAIVLRQKVVARPSERTICQHAAMPDQHGSLRWRTSSQISRPLETRCRVKRSVGRSVVPSANASVPSCTPADGPAGMADGGSGHADASNSCPTQAAA